MAGNVLIIGSHGRFGANAVTAFTAAGWQVTRFDRSRDDLMQAAQGRDVIVMAGSPRGYQDWAREVMPMHRPVAEAARASGATLIVPGNVYVYGPDAPFGWTAQTPHLATNPLAKLRIELEEMYRTCGARVIYLRCGDFLDTGATGNWFDLMIAKRAHRGRISYPGPLDRPHAWAYLPDAARAALRLAEMRDRLGPWEDIPFPGYTLTGHDLAALCAEALHHPVAARRMAWWPLILAQPVAPLMRGLVEMRYLWSLPQRLDGTRLHQLLPDWQDTPPAEAIARALSALPR